MISCFLKRFKILLSVGVVIWSFCALYVIADEQQSMKSKIATRDSFSAYDFIEAVTEGDIAKVQSSIDKGINVNIIIYDEPVLITAVLFEQDKIVKLLLANGADIDIESASGMTALLHALSEKNLRTSVVRILVKNGADVNKGPQKNVLNKKDFKKLRPLALAIINNDIDIIRLLIDRGAEVDFRGAEGWTGLMSAAYDGFYDVVELLLDRGASTDIYNDEGKSALHLATQIPENRDVVNLLIKKGINANKRDEFGKSALHYAVIVRNKENVKMLLNYEIIIDLKDNRGRTPLLEAAYQGDADIIQMILESGANKDAVDKKGQTALHIAMIPLAGIGTLAPLFYDSEKKHRAAAGEFNIEVIRKLLEAGTDVNKQNFNGETPLLSSIVYSDIEIVNLLLKYGANPTIASKKN